jgi:RNA polymerase sigma-70 factor (ECF subfamily)
VVRLHRTIALGQVMGPEKALSEADTLAPLLDRYHLLHATRAEFLRRAGRTGDARAAYARALDLAETDHEHQFLTRRLEELA